MQQNHHQLLWPSADRRSAAVMPPGGRRRCHRGADRLLRRPTSVVLVLPATAVATRRRCGRGSRAVIRRGWRSPRRHDSRSRDCRGLAEPQLWRTASRTGTLVISCALVLTSRCTFAADADRVGVEHRVHLVGLLEEDLRGRVVCCRPRRATASAPSSVSASIADRPAPRRSAARACRRDPARASSASARCQFAPAWTEAPARSAAGA